MSYRIVDSFRAGPEWNCVPSWSCSKVQYAGWEQSALIRYTVQPFTESDNTRCCDNTISSPEDGHVNARNIRIKYCYRVKELCIKLAIETSLYYDARSEKTSNHNIWQTVVVQHTTQTSQSVTCEQACRTADLLQRLTFKKQILVINSKFYWTVYDLRIKFLENFI